MAEEKKYPTKKPTALKRDIQNLRKYQSNKQLKSRIRTSYRTLETSVKNKEVQKSIQTNLSSVYSLLDRAVKKGFYHKNKCARAKSRIGKKINA